MSPMSLSVVILTFNSEATIGATLASARRVSDDIHVVDSGSTDRTRAIAAEHGARVTEHPFESYGAQRNWAIDTLALRHGWELHLDADERLSEALIAAIEGLTASGFAGPAVGYFIPRLVHFLGRPIRHGGIDPICHMRLFRHGSRRYVRGCSDHPFYVDRPTAGL